MPLQVLVSSTRNATFKQQVASRLRETLVFLVNCALVYAKHYFCSARLAGLGVAVTLRRLTIPKNTCSRLRETTLFKNCSQKLLKTLSKMTCKKYRCRLVHAKRYVFSETCVSPTRDTTFSRQSGPGFVAGPPPEAGHMAF